MQLCQGTNFQFDMRSELVSLSGENQVLHMPVGPQPVTRTHGTTTTANLVNILRLWCPPDIDGCELQFAAISIR